MKNNRGITLIALVVTIIILIILAGVSVNLLFGENGIILKAKESKETHEIAAILEKLELLKVPIQVDKQIVTVDDYLKQLENPNIADFSISDIEIVDENNVYIIVNEKYKFSLVYEANGNLKIEHEGKIEGIVDTVLPQEAIIEITGETTVTTLPATLNVKVTHVDNESGVNIEQCKYILNTSSDNLGTEASSYEKTFDPAEESIPVELAVAGNYYLHILTVDNKGNAKETIEGPITVTATYHTHTGSSSKNGGCYTTPKYHSHGSSCYTTETYSENGGCSGKGHSVSGKLVDWVANPYYSDYCNSCNHWCGNYDKTKQVLTCKISTSTPIKYDLGCKKTEDTIDGYAITY